ncbi:MAG TPA: class I SAM-dependent rRNA methyltransferase, partial [Casimicrobiaceae bacterium]|nr:class I SAM-dependent rRNA methyltransferase [Casimicrobiaceae bacterium]
MTPSNGVLRLKAGRARSLALRHPWIFSGAIDDVDGNPAPGATVDVVDAAGAFAARAAWSPVSQIRARVWSFEAATAIDDAFFTRSIARAVAARGGMLDHEHTACRLVHAESDGLPGLVADRYGDTVVVQLLSAGAEAWRDTIAGALQQATGARCVFERSDADVRSLEGLGSRTGPVIGVLPPDVAIVEGGLRYRIDIERGQKTGFYLDQRDNRALAASLAAGREVLNAFCYTGGFSLSCLKAGASRVTSLDTSEEALAIARRHVEINALDASRAEWLNADVFSQLRKFRDQNRKFG